jgi:hypothetical protein
MRKLTIPLTPVRVYLDLDCLLINGDFVHSYLLSVILTVQRWSEALHGVASSPGVSFAKSGDYSYSTSFPQPITMGAAFDDELILKVATVVSTEARAFNNVQRSGLNYWTPNINPYKE